MGHLVSRKYLVSSRLFTYLEGDSTAVMRWAKAGEL